MTNGREKSHSAVVAAKPTNNASVSKAEAAEPVEPRAGTKRNVGEHDTHRTLGRARVTQALDRVQQPSKGRRRSSQRSFTTSASICSGKRSLRSSAMPPLVWTG